MLSTRPASRCSSTCCTHAVVESPPQPSSTVPTMGRGEPPASPAHILHTLTLSCARQPHTARRRRCTHPCANRPHFAQDFISIHVGSAHGNIREHHLHENLVLTVYGAALEPCSTSEVPKTNDHGMLPYETITKVRSSPSHSHFHRLALPAHTALQTFPTFSAFFLPTAAPAGMLSAHSHDHRSVLSRSLSGGKLPLEYSNISAAAAAAAAARWAAARLARATTVDDVDGRGRIEVATPATVAAVRAAEAPRAGAGAAVACGAAAPVAGGGALGSLRARAVDFYVCVGRAARARGS